MNSHKRMYLFGGVFAVPVFHTPEKQVTSVHICRVVEKTCRTKSAAGFLLRFSYARRGEENFVKNIFPKSIDKIWARGV